MPTRTEVLLDPGTLSDWKLAPHEAPHLGQSPAALLVLGPADRAVGMGVEVLRPQAVPRPQGDDTHAVGRQAHGIGNGGGRRAFDRGAPQDLLVTLGKPSKGRANQCVVDARARVVCRSGRRRCLQARVFGRDDPQLTARIIDGDGAHRGQEIGTEVGQRTLAGPDQVIDPQARLSDDVLSGGASTVAVGHGIRGGQVPTPQLGVSLGVPAPDHPQEGDIVSVRPLLTPE